MVSLQGGDDGEWQNEKGVVRKGEEAVEDRKER